MAQKFNIDGVDGFWGFYTLNDNMKTEPGVYVIFNGPGATFVDVGQSDDLNARPKNHERKPCWIKHCSKGIYFAAKLIKNAEERTSVEQTIRNNHPEMPCGER